MYMYDYLTYIEKYEKLRISGITPLTFTSSHHPVKSVFLMFTAAVEHNYHGHWGSGSCQFSPLLLDKISKDNAVKSDLDEGLGKVCLEERQTRRYLSSLANQIESMCHLERSSSTHHSVDNVSIFSTLTSMSCDRDLVSHEVNSWGLISG